MTETEIKDIFNQIKTVVNSHYSSGRENAPENIVIDAIMMDLNQLEKDYTKDLNN